MSPCKLTRQHEGMRMDRKRDHPHGTRRLHTFLELNGDKTVDEGVGREQMGAEQSIHRHFAWRYLDARPSGAPCTLSARLAINGRQAEMEES